MSGGTGLSKGEKIAVLAYFPLHLAVLPLLAGILLRAGRTDETTANFLVYAVGTAWMLLLLGRFLRRQFDPLCDRFFFCLLQAAGSYLLIVFCNTIMVQLLSLAAAGGMNPNSAAVLDMASSRPGMTTAMTVFLAPIVEECLFRAGLFGVLREKSRWAAYGVSAVLFSLYHIWPLLFADARNALFILQYLPASLLLARCYEKTGSIWTPVFLHMLVNGISMAAMRGGA